MVTEAIMGPLYAPLSGRLGRRPVVLVLQCMWGVFAIGFGLVQSVWVCSAPAGLSRVRGIDMKLDA